MNIVNSCFTAFNKHYVYPEMIPRIEEFVRRKIVEGQYKNVSNLLELTKQLRKDFRYISNDRHIWIDIMQNIPVKDSDVSDEDKIKELRKTNFGFVKFEILEGNIAYLRLDGFKNLDYAEKTAAAVMCSLAYSDAIIFDLRFNHGGNGNMVHFLSSYFFEKKTQLTSLYFREADSLATAWTDPNVPGKKLLQQPLFILTSKNTASAAESFAYTMKNYNRATVVGKYTRGAGHWNESYQFPQLGIFLEIPVARPINPVTNTGWEGKGVQPDVEISEKDALDKAYHLALEKKRSP
ncbi:S41 family peptidase [bacterium]